MIPVEREPLNTGASLYLAYPAATGTGKVTPSSRFVSLLMLANYAQAFAILAADLEKARAQILIAAAELHVTKISPELGRFNEFRDNLLKLIATCQQVPQLDRMMGPLGRLLANLDSGMDASHFHYHVDFIQLQLFDELNRLKLYHVEDRYVDLYENPQPFGDQVFTAFPSAVLDSQKAAQCLALGQPTAAMFHLMRVVEHGLTAYGEKLGIGYAPSWEAYERKLHREFSIEFNKRTKTWQREDGFHKKVLGDITAIRIAWRNPTVHIVHDYDIAEAETSFLAVGQFMGHLSTKVKEKRQRSPRSA